MPYWISGRISLLPPIYRRRQKRQRNNIIKENSAKMGFSLEGVFFKIGWRMSLALRLSSNPYKHALDPWTGCPLGLFTGYFRKKKMVH